MNKKERKIIKKILHEMLQVIGVMFFFLGVIGIFIPVFPQLPFLIIGLLILGEESIYTGWIFKKLPPKVGNKLRHYLDKTRRFLRIKQED